MKSVNAILLALLVFISTTGLTVKKHYCGNKLYGVNLLIDPGCDCVDEADMDRCCHNEVRTFQLRAHFFTEPNALIPQAVPVATLHMLSWIAHPLVLSHATLPFSLHYPPPGGTDHFSALQFFRL